MFDLRNKAFMRFSNQAWLNTTKQPCVIRLNLWGTDFMCKSVDKLLIFMSDQIPWRNHSNPVCSSYSKTLDRYDRTCWNAFKLCKALSLSLSFTLCDIKDLSKNVSCNSCQTAWWARHAFTICRCNLMSETILSRGHNYAQVGCMQICLHPNSLS